MIENHPKQITVIAPSTAFAFCVGSGTGNIIYPLLPVIYDVSYKNHIRPARPLTLTVVQSGMALAASPVSAAMAAMLTLTEVAPYNLGLTQILAITLPACIIGIVVTALVVNRMWKDLDDDPEVQARIASGVLAAPEARQAAVPVGASSRRCAGASGAPVVAPDTRTPVAPSRVPTWPASTRPPEAAPLLRPNRSPAPPGSRTPRRAQLGAGLPARGDRHRRSRPLPQPAPGLRGRGRGPVPIDMTTTIVLVMFVVGTIILFVGRPEVKTVPDQSVFKAGMISAIALFGIAWLTATFIAAHEDYIIETVGAWVTDWRFLFALAVFIVAALTTSQSTATRTIVPIGLAAGLPAGDRDRHVGRSAGRRLHPAGQRHPDRRRQLRPLGNDEAGVQAGRPQLLHPDADHVRRHDRRRCGHRRLALLTPTSLPCTPKPGTDPVMDVDEIVRKASDAMPELVRDLERLVAIPSIAFSGYPAEPVQRMGQVTLDLFQKAGFRDARLLEVPSGYPPIYAELPGPEGSPVVVLYAHYDVQPAPRSRAGARTLDPDPQGGRSHLLARGRRRHQRPRGPPRDHARLRRQPPCTVKLILEGMEETESNLEAFVEAHPELFDCDLFVICDVGNLRVGEPAFTTALRGDVACIVTVRTLQHPLHSGVFGGPAPDAMMALARLLATLQDDKGNVAVEGVTTGSWPGEQFTEEDLRSSADILDGLTLTGTGPVGDRLWAHPSINAIGLDMTSIAGSSNVLIPEASAKLSMRIVPDTDPNTELDELVAHLQSHAPWGGQG